MKWVCVSLFRDPAAGLQPHAEYPAGHGGGCRSLHLHRLQPARLCPLLSSRPGHRWVSHTHTHTHAEDTRIHSHTHSPLTLVFWRALRPDITVPSPCVHTGVSHSQQTVHCSCSCDALCCRVKLSTVQINIIDWYILRMNNWMCFVTNGWTKRLFNTVGAV